MTKTLIRQVHCAFAVGLAALFLIEGSAVAKARDLTFQGNAWIAAGAVAFAVIALWLTCVGALRSDRAERGRSSANSADRSGPVYTDIDGHMHVH
jgi:hypothetical protein